MVYLEKFLFPDLEHDQIPPDDSLGSFYGDCYPFKITSPMELWSLDFEPVTILHGSNGSGKSTILNLIGRKLFADRKIAYNTSVYFDAYVNKCQYKAVDTLEGETIYGGVRDKPQKYDIANITHVITSDDIFHLMHERRLVNDQKLHKSQFLFEDYCIPEELPRHLNLETGYNVGVYKKGVDLRKAKRNKSFNKYLLNALGEMERGFSNGETALMKLSEWIEKPGIYLLDEPENSMSCEFQERLASIITYLAKYGRCQFVIATHSPFILSIEGAKIYNLDHTPVNVCQWWELDNMQRYFRLFENEREKFLAELRGGKA